MKTIIAALLALSLTSFALAHDRARKHESPALTAYYHLPAAFKHLAPAGSGAGKGQLCAV